MRPRGGKPENKKSKRSSNPTDTYVRISMAFIGFLDLTRLYNYHNVVTYHVTVLFSSFLPCSLFSFFLSLTQLLSLFHDLHRLFSPHLTLLSTYSATY
jgi:hypothetical protein